MKKFKRLSSLLLVCCLTVGMVPIGASAEETVSQSNEQVQFSGGTELPEEECTEIVYSIENEQKGNSPQRSAFQGHTYQLFNEAMTWMEAKVYCENLGGHLATITSVEEQEFIEPLIENGEKNFYWLGGTDNESEGQWEWITGETWIYENWGDGQPNNDRDGRSEDFLAIIKIQQHWNGYTQEVFEWNDFSNVDANLMGYICEWESNTVEEIRSDFVNAGPGEKYAREEGFENTQVTPVSVENGYCEIEYKRNGTLRRDYVKKELVSGTEKVPVVSSTVIQGPSMQQYIYKVHVNANTVKETKVYTGPTDKYAVRDILAEGEPITFLYTVNVDSVISARRSYVIEYKTSKGLKRGYILNRVYNDIMNDPLKGFDKDKTNNAAFIYENEIAYSSFSATDCSRVNLSDNWSNASHIDFTFFEKFDWWAGITAAISGNTGDVPEDNFSAVTDGISMLINFFTAGIKNTAVSVNVDKYKGERRIIIHTGSPIEFDHAGKTIYLASILAQPGSYTISEDEWIRRAFTGLKSDGKYSMNLTFSKDFSSCPYGYSLVVKKDGSVWAYPIIHSGTSFKVYWRKDGKSEYAFDAADIWGRQAAKLSGDKAAQLINELDKHGFKFSKSQEQAKKFSDVSPNAYYNDAVQWAVISGVTAGTSATTFSPNQSCTRAQAVTFLWNAANRPEPQGSGNQFTDVKSGSYYEKAVQWAVENQITGGTGDNTFSPDSTCTRAQIVTFLYHAASSPAVSGSGSFTDVKSGSYYEDAVNWAVENGITSGTGNGRFSPGDNCVRAQIVTFLYNYHH